MKPKQKKNRSFLHCVKEQIHICFRKFSERTNLKLIFFKIFTFASQRRLLELLSYGEYNQLSISVICFLKTTLLSVFIHLFFSCVKLSPPT